MVDIYEIKETADRVYVPPEPGQAQQLCPESTRALYSHLIGCVSEGVRLEGDRVVVRGEKTTSIQKRIK